ncbi:MAG: transporter substrate-binding domain-containing protein [Deferrisomatales bacterium]
MGRIGATVWALALALTAGSAGPGWAAGVLDRVKGSGELVAGVLADAPPFGFRDRESGQLTGYDVDTVAAVAARLGVRVRLRAVTEADRLAALLDGTVDILAAALVHSDARTAVIDVTDPYLVSGQKLIARTGAIAGPEDLEGKRIGAVVGTFAESCARDRCRVSRIVPFDDYLDGVRALQEGKIDAFTADESILVDLFAGLLGGFEIADHLVLREEYHLGVRKGDRAFADAVNQALRAMQADGDAARIRRRWFTPAERLPPPAYGSVVRKAASPPRFLGLALSGLLHPGTEVSVFALSGEQLGKGKISSVFGDEFYVDVEPGIYDFVRPGFLIAMNMNSQMAIDVLLRRQTTLEDVKEQAEKDAEQLQAQKTQEALAKQQRAVEMDTFREQTRESVQADRTRYFYLYGRRRFR